MVQVVTCFGNQVYKLACFYLVLLADSQPSKPTNQNLKDLKRAFDKVGHDFCFAHY